MKEINESAVEKMILVADNEGPADEIKSDLPHDKNWKLVGDDMYWDGGSWFAGPSGGDPTRTAANYAEGFFCPVCNGHIDPFSFDVNGKCGCPIDDIKREYGIIE